jgi:hypothetical protein
MIIYCEIEILKIYFKIHSIRKSKEAKAKENKFLLTHSLTYMCLCCKYQVNVYTNICLLGEGIKLYYIA